MKHLSAQTVTQAVRDLFIRANTHLGADVLQALASAQTAESNPRAADILGMLLENAAVARAEKMPVCQDTGMAVVLVTVGQDVHIEGNLAEAIHEGVRYASLEGCLRASVVSDPIHRVNTGDNTPAVIHYDIVPGDLCRITVLPKGFGSENMGAVRMLTPADGLTGLEDFVVSAVKQAGGNPCPPVIVGVGVGGTMDKAVWLAKQALLRNLDCLNPDMFWSACEERLLKRINALGIGPAGLGGDTSALGVHVETFPTHIAGLPVAVNLSCHALRRAEVCL